MDKDSYLNKYLGKYDKRRTNAYVKRGNNINKYQKLVEKYDGVFAITNQNDLTGFLIEHKIYAAKNTGDHRRKSNESWEK